MVSPGAWGAFLFNFTGSIGGVLGDGTLDTMDEEAGYELEYL
jgi:hypothetical protein